MFISIKWEGKMKKKLGLLLVFTLLVVSLNGLTVFASYTVKPVKSAESKKLHYWNPAKNRQTLQMRQ